MKENDEDKSVPLLRVHTVAQRAATPERVVAVQTSSPATRDAGARPTMTTPVVSLAASEAGDRPIKRIGAADVEKM